MTLRSTALAMAFLFTTSQAMAEEPLGFALIGSESAKALNQVWTPLLDEMSTAIGQPVKPLLFDDYAGAVWSLSTGQSQIGWMGNRAAIEAVDRADCEVGLQSIDQHGSDGYISYLITRLDAALNNAQDVIAHARDLTFGFGDRNSTSGFTVPGYYLFAVHGLDPTTLFKRVTHANHEANFMAVAQGRIDVATNNSMYMPGFGVRYPELFARVKVIWQSPTIPSDPVVWRKDLAPPVKAAIRAFLLAYGQPQQDKPMEQVKAERARLALMTWSGFRDSNDGQLVPIRQLELFRTLQAVEDDPTIPKDVKAQRIAEIHEKMETLQKDQPQSARQP